MKKVFAFVMIIVLAVMVLLTGCGANKKPNDDIVIPSNDIELPSGMPVGEPAPTDENGNVIFPEDSVVTNKETIYYVLDNEGEKSGIYFTEDHPEVKKVKEVANRYMELNINRDYRTIRGDEEYETLTEDFIAYLKEQNDIEDTVKSYKNQKIVTKFLGIKEYEDCAFNTPVTKCTITFVANFVYEEISDEAAKEMGVEAGKPYAIRIMLFMDQQENGEWKIDNVGSSNIWAEEN